MHFSDKSTRSKQITNLTENMDLLCNAVVDVYEKLNSRFDALEKKLKSLDLKLDEVKVQHRLGSTNKVQNRPCSACAIS